MVLAVALIIAFTIPHITPEIKGQNNGPELLKIGIINSSDQGIEDSKGSKATTNNNSDNYTPDIITDFSGKGLISSIIPIPQSFLSEGNKTRPTVAITEQSYSNSRVDGAPYILAGYWKLTVNNGTIKSFDANFSMVHTNGLGYHTHEITNFKPNVVMPVVFDPKSGEAFFTGMMDIKEDGKVKWGGVQTRVLINNSNTIAISPDTTYIDNHFQNQPIYGVVQSLKDNKRNVLLVESPLIRH